MDFTNLKSPIYEINGWHYAKNTEGWSAFRTIGDITFIMEYYDEEGGIGILAMKNGSEGGARIMKTYVLETLVGEGYRRAYNVMTVTAKYSENRLLELYREKLLEARTAQPS